ncbi:hypothetical protein KTJ89_06860 [Brevibacterium sediminis]|uniref:hypothetical protein n=1 Tax=Brevibacterium sediminis TaxID=1857024 RepID=UPI00217501B7|nr:hypothetical protein [Brevibacterium sediminis]MCS4592699.1 hypothetical protein [Brevibacterium sediminis]
MAQNPVVPLSALSFSDLRSELVNAVSRLQVSSDGVWLEQANPYLVGGSKQVVNDCKAGTADFDKVAAYVGASSFVHCADAWSYVGRAVDALLKGDVHASVHLTYYAELRAAKSLLAAEGVFVGNRYSCALDANTTLTKVSGNVTHTAAWELIETWFQQPSSVTTIAQVVAPGGQNLQSWIGQIPGGVNAVMQDMLAGIAFDLQSFSEDRERRNLASYEPTTLMPATLNVDTIRRTVMEIWSEIEPMAGGDFPGIDRAILANVLVRQYSAQNLTPNPSDPSRGVVDWSGWVSWIDSLTPAELSPSAFKEVLRSDPTGSEFKEILGAGFVDTSAMTDPAEFIRPMLSRATFLTRIATGLCLRVLTDAGKSFRELTAWTEAFSESRGHIEAVPLPLPATDLITDLELPRMTLEESQALSLGALVRELSDGIGLLGQTDRAVSWSFA